MWGLSFFYGCRCTFWRNVMFGMDATRISQMNNVSVSIDQQTALNENIDDLNARQAKYLRRQFVLLISGAVLFIVWHVLEMATSNSNSVG